MAALRTQRLALAAVFAFSAATAATEALAQATAVIVSGTSYTQNFDGITTGSASSIASAAQGWSFFRSGTSSSLPTYTSGSNSTVVTQNAGTVGTGVVTNSSSGGAYLWVSGTLATGTDKSIGFLSTSTYPGTSSAAPGQQLAILFGFTNSTGATITNLDLGWNYERYRQGTRTQSWEFYTSSDGSTWSANTLGNSSLYSGTSTAIVYNPPESAAKAVNIPGLSIASGSNYYLRWSFVTTGSWTNSQGLGIDDFTMTLTSGSAVDPNLYWDAGSWTATAPGAGGNGSWADGSGSWDTAKKANFAGTAGTVTVGTVTASNGLVFATSGYTLTGGTISLAGASSGLNTITTGTDGTVTTTIDSAIAGSAGLMKMGGGTLVLGGANTFTGGLTLSSGTLQITSDSNLGDAAGSVSLNGTLKTTGNLSLGSGRAVSGGASLDIAPGTTLTVGGSYATASTTLLNSGTLDLQGATRSAGTLTFNTAAVVNGAGAISLTGLTATGVTSGTAVINPAITFSSGDKSVDVGSGGTLLLAGDIAGTTGRIAKTGAGTLIVSGSNSTSGFRVGSTGSTPTNGGKVILTAAAASGTGQLQLNYGTLETTAPFTFANGLSVGGRSGAVAVLGGTNAMTFSGSSNFFRGGGTSGDLRLDVNNVTTLAGVTGTTSGGGTATGITIGGTGQLIISGSAAVTDAITLQDSVRIMVENSLASTVVTVGAGNAIGGDGTILGSLAFASGADFLFDPLKTLTVNGASVTFGGFGISDLIGFSAAIPDGSYTLIDGSAVINTANLSNLGAANAVDLGGGRSAYFETGSLVLQVVPEPSAFVLAAAGLALASLRRLRRRI
jgi:autotransporter-associated beta strand protein